MKKTDLFTIYHCPDCGERAGTMNREDHARAIAAGGEPTCPQCRRPLQAAVRLLLDFTPAEFGALKKLASVTRQSLPDVLHKGWRDQLREWITQRSAARQSVPDWMPAILEEGGKRQAEPKMEAPQFGGILNG